MTAKQPATALVARWKTGRAGCRRWQAIAGGLASVAIALLGAPAALGAGAVASFAAGPVPAKVAVSVAVTTLAALAAGAARDARQPWDLHSSAAARAQACRTLGLVADPAVRLTGQRARLTPRGSALRGLSAAPRPRWPVRPEHRPATGLRPRPRARRLPPGNRSGLQTAPRPMRLPETLRPSSR